MYNRCCPRWSLDIDPNIDKTWYVVSPEEANVDLTAQIVTIGGAILFIMFGLFYLHEFWLGV
jgi:hypothetical protein